MENENQISLLGTLPSTRTGRASRRNKILPQKERDKDQENIGSKLNDADQLEQASKSVMVKIDENKQTVTPESAVIPESSSVNSSTPRKKKDPLAHLHSNLSPKYIGITTPTSKIDNALKERPRSTRSRQYKTDSGKITVDCDASLSMDNSLDMTEVGTIHLLAGPLDGTPSLGYVRRTGIILREDSNNSSPEHMSVKKKEYLSPIDKLLKKNGSLICDIHELSLEDENNADKILNGTVDLTDSQTELGKVELYEQNNNDTNEAKVKRIEQTKSFEKETSIKAIKIEDIFASDSEDEIAIVEEEFQDITKDQNKEAVENKQENIDVNVVIVEDSVTDAADLEDSAAYDLEFTKTKNEMSQTKDDDALETNELLQKGKSDKQLSGKQVENMAAGQESNTIQVATLDNEKIVTNAPTVNNIQGKDSSLSKETNVLKLGKDNVPIENGKLESNLNEQHCGTDVKFEYEETESTSDLINSSVNSPSAVSMDSAKGSSIINEGSWMTFIVGDVFWGQIYNYCYWPCMVCPDPEGKTISTKETIGDQHVLVHVRFFADNGRRNWVRRENLIPYTTLESYQEKINECRVKYGPKSAKYKLFVPNKAKAPVWRNAVTEMEIVAHMEHEKRLETFFEIFERSKAFQKKEKQRRKSLYLPIGRHISISDAESFYGSNENMNNLNPATENQKRERSVSPFSPAFSPVKKRKLLVNSVQPSSNNITNSATQVSNDAELRRESQSGSNSSTMTSLDIFQGTEFEGFLAVMRDFVLDKNQNELLENGLFVAVRNIWALRQVSREQMEQKLRNSMNKIDEKDDTPIGGAAEGGGEVKRLSNRLKNLLARKSSTHQKVTSSYDDLTKETSTAAKGSNEQTPLNSTEKPKRPPIINRPILEVIDDIFDLDNKYLFKGMGRDPVCKYCFKPGGNLQRCSKNCNSWLHSDCLHIDFNANSKSKRNNKRLNGINFIKETSNESAATSSATDRTVGDSIEELSSLAVVHVTSETFTSDEEVICKECANNEPAKCMVCHLTESLKPEDPLVKCNTAQCDRSFHPACCKYWPQSKLTVSKNHIQSFRCPSHVCHTCVSDDPKGKFQHITANKITKCVKCPATYHTDSTCIPAGSQILTTAHIICPRHTNSKPDLTVNVNWCFICVGGGQLVCCETCPTAVHAQCLQIPIDPNEGYICEECESGRMPLYGEMVWAKFNNFRWWPAIILPPTEIPKNIAKKSHNPSDFVVRFFGTHDHGWISRRRVYLYLEDDSTEPPKSKSNRDLNFSRGTEEAKQIYAILKNKKIEQRNSNENKEKLYPQPYARIKANRAVPPVKLHVDMERVNKCECNSDDVNPCGPDTNCLNRVLYHECNPKICPAGKYCQNQMFESRISPRLDVVYMKERGFGLVSREPIASGSFVIEYVGEIINDDEFRARMSQKSLDRDENFYFLSVEKDYIIDAGPKGNLARFMNHSCDPNCETQKWSVNSLNRVGLFAIKDIPENTELTFNYHWDDLLGNEKKTCFCGSKKCAGQIGGKIKDESKEPSPISDLVLKSKAKSKLKPLKRLKSKKSGVKRKAPNKPKLNVAKHKSNKMAAAANVAAALSRSKSKSPQTTMASGIKISVDDHIESSSTTSRSHTPEDVFC